MWSFSWVPESLDDSPKTSMKIIDYLKNHHHGVMKNKNKNLIKIVKNV